MESKTKLYSAKLDFLAILMTMAVFLLVSILGFLSFKNFDLIAPFLIFFFVFMVAFFRMPKGYLLGPEYIIIMRIFNNKTINIKDLNSFSVLSKSEFTRHTTRSFGSYALFGYSGIFTHDKLATLKVYGTDRKNFIVLHKKNTENLAITPNELFDFIAELKKYVSKND